MMEYELLDEEKLEMSDNESVGTQPEDSKNIRKNKTNF